MAKGTREARGSGEQVAYLFHSSLFVLNEVLEHIDHLFAISGCMWQIQHAIEIAERNSGKDLEWSLY